jgi:hypothetical protein
VDRFADVIFIHGMEVDERDAFVRIDVGGRFVIGVLASCLPVDKLDPDLSDVDRAEADVVGEFLPDKKNRIIRGEGLSGELEPGIDRRGSARPRGDRDQREKEEKRRSGPPPGRVAQQQSP